MENTSGCIFCRIIKKEVKADIVQESANFIAFLDIHPKKPGHTLIVPKKHYENLLDFPTIGADELFLIAKKIAEKRFKEGAEGFNLITNNGKAAGQVVNHVHFHLIPRKSGDGGLLDGKEL